MLATKLESTPRKVYVNYIICTKTTCTKKYQDQLSMENKNINEKWESKNLEVTKKWNRNRKPNFK